LDLFLRDAASLHEDQPLLAQPEPHRYATDWSRDGRFVLFTQRNVKTGDDMWMVSMEGMRTARPLLATRFNEAQAQFSPDGTWIAYTSDDSGVAQVYVMAVDAGQRRQVSVSGGVEPRWRADGRELFFISAGGMMSSVPIQTQPSWSTGQPHELFRCASERRLNWTSGLEYDVSKDGTRFVIAERQMRNLDFTVRLER
jgi:eukaryotic-like serine/threonine-protein kinase